MAVVKDVEVRWAHVQNPSQYKKYSIDAFIPKELAKEWKDKGISGMCKENGKAQKNKAGGILWQFRTNAIDKNGQPVPKPPVVDAGKNPVTKLVGNGSICNIQYNIGPWEYAGKKGETPYLQRTQVKELVEYEGGSNADEFEEEDGFVATDSGDEFEAAGTSDIDDDNPFDD